MNTRAAGAWWRGCRTAATCSRRSPPSPTRTTCEAAELRAIGALKTARLAFYDQSAHTYGEFAVDAPVELLALLGNVSRKDGATFVHAHATLAGHDGACVGGHVAPGCEIFACELLLQELVGEPLEREFDEVTGLALWRGL